MRPFYKRFSVISGFSVLLVLLLLNAFVIRRQVGVQVASQAWVIHTQRVLFQLSETESLLKDAETGQRGYLYTGEPRYLAPYDLAAGQIETHLQKLAELTVDNPEQLTDVARLRLLAHQKLGELSQTIQLYQSGNLEGARQLVLSNAGLLTMGKIRGLVKEMEQEEATLAAARTVAYRHSIQVTIACINIACIVAIAGLILLAYFILREMELREKHSAQIRQREEWYRVTLTSLGDGVIATDDRGNVSFVNPVAERLTGRTLAQAKGKPVTEVFPIFNEVTHDPVDNPVKKVMELGRIIGLANHTVLRQPNGTLIPIEDSAAPIHDDQGGLLGVVLVFRDATHERKSQEIMRKTEKIAAAARLAATVAHEINNPLEAVCNLIYLAKNRPGLPPDVHLDLTRAEEELERVSHISRQTLGFYRDSMEPAALDVPALVDSVLKLYRSKLKSKSIRVERDVQDCPPVRGWPGELQQLISNLVSNAADAVSMEGTIRIKVCCVENSDGRAVQFSVSDNGHGICPEHLGRIFEPFFTTKKDVGTGLGLWVSKEIAERHGGTIHVDSRAEGGSGSTVFTVLLPCFENQKRHLAEAV